MAIVDEGGISDLEADAVVLAAGSWSSLVPGAKEAFAEVRPVRGQIVLLEERPPRLRSIVIGGGAYAVPREATVACGARSDDGARRISSLASSPPAACNRS